MPIHNGEQFVAEAIQSLIAQTHTNWELVAVLDGCTDETEAAIRRFRDSRLRMIPLTPPGGFARALNYGLEHCQSELVARLDHDDVSLPTRLERQVAPNWRCSGPGRRSLTSPERWWGSEQ